MARNNAVTNWKSDPVAFIAAVLRDPETHRPFTLYPAQARFLREGLTVGADGRLPYPDLVYGLPKKNGKTATAAMVAIYVAVAIGGPYAEVYLVANDLEQSVGRVFTAAARIIQASPLLRGSAKVTASRIEFTSTGSFIQAVASEYAGFAGANPSLVIYDELWAFTSERSHRLWDEGVPSPTRKVTARLVTTLAGFEGESTVLKRVYDRGLQGSEIGPALYAQPGRMLMFWSHEQCAPWITAEWIEERRAEYRPNQFARMIENRWVSTENPFIELRHWDACVNPSLRPSLSDRCLPVHIGVDASVKHDSTGLAMVTYDRKYEAVRLVTHAVFEPSPDQPLDFEATVERTLREWSRRFDVSGVFYDPYQMASTAQRLKHAGLPMREYPQSIPNLSAATVNLFELVRDQRLMVYPSDELRTAISRTTVVESSRGMKLAKEKSSYKIDIVVALSMAALAAVEAKATGRAVVRDLVTGELLYGVSQPDLTPIDVSFNSGVRFVPIAPGELPDS